MYKRQAIKNQLISINVIDLREYGEGSYKQVDDTPYGGGSGMLLKPEPIFNAFESIQKFDNNITFIGDSAHPIVPFMGQGGCLALEDAYAFGNLLHRHNSDFRKTQNRYQQLRIDRIKSIHIQSLNQAKLNHLSNPILIFFRNLLMKYTGVISNRTKNIWSYDITKALDSNDFK